jgi:peptidyl-prolyl cis-trans isomerase C
MAQKAATIPVEDLETKVQEQLRALRAEFDDKTFAEALRAQGLTAAGLQQRITETLRIETLIDREVRAKIAVTEAEAKTFYDQNPDYFTQPAQVRASHILVTVPDDADDAAKAAKRKAIDAARARIVAGEDFAKVAAEVSACPSKSRGGDLDFFGPGQMVPAFEEAAFALKSNEVSEVVTTRFGYHLIKQTGNRPGSLTPFAQAQDRIIQFLRQQKLRTGLLAYVAALRKDAKVEVLLK